jgi:hypothetical protein
MEKVEIVATGGKQLFIQSHQTQINFDTVVFLITYRLEPNSHSRRSRLFYTV